MYTGQPADYEDRPSYIPSSLPPSLYSIGDYKYSVGHNSLDVFALQGESDTQLTQSPYNSAAAQSETAKTESFAAGLSEEAPSLLAPVAYWVATTQKHMHPLAVQVGSDMESGALFVGRALVQGELLPGKVAERHGLCYVSFHGKEIAATAYELLVLERGRVEWVACKDGAFPAHALPAGLTEKGTTIYAVRRRVCGVMLPGRLVQGEKECRISYDLREVHFSDYEVLTLRCIDPNQYGGATRHVPEMILHKLEPLCYEGDSDGWIGPDIEDDSD